MVPTGIYPWGYTVGSIMTRGADMYRDIDARELAARLGTDTEPLVLDVREPDEVAEWAIPGSMNIPVRELGQRIDELPRDREVVVVCASGSRSAVAADALARAGLRVANLRGGMAA
jgi:rhodanese-related sulfurtransferase